MKIEWTKDALLSYDMVLSYTAENFGAHQVRNIRTIIEAKIVKSSGTVL